MLAECHQGEHARGVRCGVERGLTPCSEQVRAVLDALDAAHASTRA